MPSEDLTQFDEIFHEVNELVSLDSDLDGFLQSVRRCLVEKLRLKFAFTVVRGENHTLDCRTDYLADRIELKPSETPRDNGTPICSVELISGKRSDFVGPGQICEDCHFFHDCENSISFVSRLSFGSETIGVLGLSATDLTPNRLDLFRLVVSHLCLAAEVRLLDTKAKESTEAHSQTTHRLELALNGGAQGLWEWNIENGDMVFDDHWNYLFELEDSEHRINWSANPWDRIVLDGDNPAVYEARFSQSGEELSFYESEHRVRIRSNQWRWVLIKGSVTERSKNGDPLHASGTILDITSRKLSEQEKDKLAEQLRQIQKIESIGRLAGGIAHDLNNLLSPVIGYSEMALFDLHPEDTLYEDISQVRDAAHRAKDLTQQLLAFSRKQVLDMQAIDINSIVSNSENILRRLIREDIEINYRLDPDIGTIRGDRSQIQQILMNLATNAADAMPDGGEMFVETQNVECDASYVSLHPVAEEGKYALLSVSDTGSGMGKETLACIFDPFFTTKKKGRGTGLGLSTVYGIVKQHGGYVWAYSEPDIGSTLKAYIPIVEEEATVPRNSSYSPDDTFGSENILVVEDEEAVRRLICRILGKQGYDVIEAVSVTHALEIVRAKDAEIDLMITDVVMPGMNGKELYDKVVLKRPEIRVLYVSGYTDDVIAHHGVLDDGVRFVQKPFSVESLTTKVRKALDD